MEEEYLIKKWLADELSDTEWEEFKKMVTSLHEEREGRVGNVGRRMISIDDKS